MTPEHHKTTGSVERRVFGTIVYNPKRHFLFSASKAATAVFVVATEGGIYSRGIPSSRRTHTTHTHKRAAELYCTQTTNAFPKN